MPLTIIRDNLISMNVDAIVNSSNSRLEKGEGICKAIFEAAGEKELKSACNQIPLKGGVRCKMCEAVITPGFNLNAGNIIHTVGPIWQNGEKGEYNNLKRCYTNCLRAANDNGFVSIAFPLISSGSYGFRMKEALTAAVEGILSVVFEYPDMRIFLVLFSSEAYGTACQMVTNVEDNLNGTSISLTRNARDSFQYKYDLDMQNGFGAHTTLDNAMNLDNYLSVQNHSFKDELEQYLIKSELSSIKDLQNASKIDRRTFWKIMNQSDYNIGKSSVLALAIAMKLDYYETEKLLRCAGYALSPLVLEDRIVSYHILRKIYDIDIINRELQSNACTLHLGYKAQFHG